MKTKIQKGDYVLIKDTFGVQHVVRVDSFDEFPGVKNFKVYKATVKKSIEESTLNTTTFHDGDIQLVLGKINMKTLESDFPEIFL